MKKTNVYRLLRIDYVEKPTYYQVEEAEHVFFDLIRVSKWTPVARGQNYDEVCDLLNAFERAEHNRTRPNPTITVLRDVYYP